MKSATLLAVALLAGLPQDKPVYKAGTDVAVLDVIVTDKTGNLITNLKPADFVITTKKGTRTIASLEFVNTRLPAVRPEVVLPEAGLLPQKASSNVGKPLGRSFLLAIDVGEIRAGEGRIAMQQVTAFVDALPAEDLVGLVILPNGTPRVELTTNRRVIREQLSLTTGASERYRSCAATLGEAAGISAGDRSAQRAFFERMELLKGRCARGFPVNLTLAEFRMQTRNKLDTLGSLADRMALISGQKTIVLISEGLFTDRETQDAVATFARRTGASHVRLYALHLDAPIAEAAYLVPADTRNLDDHLGFDGMADVATATGGTALRAIARATGPLNQIDREASGYYLIGVETDASERDGRHVEFKIRVKTPGLEVRARPAFVHAPVASEKTDRIAPTSTAMKAAIGETLRWPVDESAFRIDLDVIRFPTPGASSATRAFIFAEFDEAPAAVGFEISDSNGKVVADTFESPVANTSRGSRSIYSGAATLTPGEYRLKIAAIGDDGRRGGVTHSFSVTTPTDASIRASDVSLGEDNGTPWRPIAKIIARQAQIGVRMDFSAGSTALLAPVTARLSVGRVGQTGWLAEAALPIAEVSGDALSRSARGAINLGQLKADDYVLKVELRSGEIIVATTAKVVHID